jgi:hypothetical protein
VRALCLAKQGGEVFQANPFSLIAAALTVRAESIAGVFATLVVFAFAGWQIGLTLAVFASGEDVDLDHKSSFLSRLTPG